MSMNTKGQMKIITCLRHHLSQHANNTCGKKYYNLGTMNLSTFCNFKITMHFPVKYSYLNIILSFYFITLLFLT